MKLSELRPCDRCGKPIAPIFYRVVVEQHLVNPEAANEVLGLRQMVGSLRLAETMASRPDATTALAPLTETLLLCQSCGIYAMGPAIEAKNERSRQGEPEQAAAGGGR